MRVYLLRAASNSYECLIMTRGDLYEFAGRFNGKAVACPWTDVRIEVYPESVPKGDYPSLIPSVPVFSRKAVEALSELLEGSGEILPIMIGEEEYYLYNVTRVIDALDESRSEIVRFKCDGRIMHVDAHVFFGDRLSGTVIFKIPQEMGRVFVTDTFVARVLSAGLKGFWFIPVWTGD